MEDREAQEIVRMVESAWNFDLGVQGRSVWRDVILPYDAEIATKAVSSLAREMSFRPTASDVRSVILKLTRDRQAETWRELPAGPTPVPEWVKRWKLARKAQDQRLFPEQIPGYLELQKNHPLNVKAYALPATPVTDTKDWIQEGEYA